VDAFAQIRQLELERHSVFHGEPYGRGNPQSIRQVRILEQLRRIHHVGARHAPWRTTQRVKAPLNQACH